jgi:hypothetical protein
MKGYNRRGESEFQDETPELVEVIKALNRWLHLELSQSLLVKLTAVGHLEMWNILVGGFVWVTPLLMLAQRVLCLPPSEAHSGRTMSQMHLIHDSWSSCGSHKRRNLVELNAHDYVCSALRFSGF